MTARSGDQLQDQAINSIRRLKVTRAALAYAGKTYRALCLGPRDVDIEQGSDTRIEVARAYMAVEREHARQRRAVRLACDRLAGMS